MCVIAPPPPPPTASVAPVLAVPVEIVDAVNTCRREREIEREGGGGGGGVGRMERERGLGNLSPVGPQT